MSKPGGKVLPFPSPNPIDELLYNFAIDSFELRSEHERFLDHVVAFVDLPGSGPFTVSIDGFASRTGTAKHNQKLSEDREQAVENYIRAHTKAFDGGRANKINRNFHGFTDSPPGEKETFRSVRIVVHPPAAPPIPVPVPPAPPPLSTKAIGAFQVDLIGWIPQPEVDNPLSLLPAFVKSHLPPGMADPFFGGDDFATPGITPAMVRPPSHTFRASQHLEFEISAWGAAPTVGFSTTVPGTTTCLDKRRAAGGTVTFSLTATLVRSSADVRFSPGDDWYEVILSGVVLDPVPAAAAAALTSKISTLPVALRGTLTKIVADLVTKATPSLSWDATLRIQLGAKLSWVVAANYALFVGSESSGTLPGAKSALAPGANLIHGKIGFELWPSAVIFVTFTPPGGSPAIQPIFFSSGVGVPRPEPAFIEVPKLCRLRQITW